MDSTVYGKLSALEAKNRELNDRLVGLEKRIVVLEKAHASQSAPAEITRHEPTHEELVREIIERMKQPTAVATIPTRSILKLSTSTKKKTKAKGRTRAQARTVPARKKPRRVF